MTTVRELHDQASSRARRIQHLLLTTDVGAADILSSPLPAMEEVRTLSAEALVYEEQAANLVPVVGGEPTRFILFLGAASFAMMAGQLEKATALLVQGRSTCDPDWTPPDHLQKKYLNLMACIVSLEFTYKVRYQQKEEQNNGI